MGGITRLGDKSSGHPCFPPVPSIEGDPDFIQDGKPVVITTHKYAIHCCGPSCHQGLLDSKQTTWYHKGKAVGIIGDPKTCDPNDKVIEGSSNAFIV
jgi:uncharacterized Zn-binding protein involved in type VI secretion